MTLRRTTHAPESRHKREKPKTASFFMFFFFEMFEGGSDGCSGRPGWSEWWHSARAGKLPEPPPTSVTKALRPSPVSGVPRSGRGGGGVYS